MSAADDNAVEFLAGGGEMGARIRARDWTATTLGAPGRWPQGLKTTLRLLLSTGHPMFIWWGPDLIQFYNDAYRRSIGPERHPSALGQRGRECWEEIWPIIGPQIEQVMNGGGYTWHENQLVPITRHGQREEVYWTYSYGPIDEPTAANGIGGVLVVCTETTQQVLAERRLKQAEESWRQLFHQAPGFMCTMRGPDHVFEFANPRYIELVGGRNIIGLPIREALPEIESQGFVDLMDQVYRTGEPYIGTATPVRLTRSNVPQEVFVDFVYQPIRNAGGTITGILVEGSDVTERVRASETLRAEDRRKDEFLAMLAHELRNPLAPIRNASALLIQASGATEQTHAIGRLLERQATQLTRLVDDLLDVSRITQGRIELQQVTVDLAATMALALETVQPLLRERHHELVVAPAAEALYVEGDPTRVTQCIVNILTNAAKYTPSHGRIAIALTREGNEGVIEVTDNGQGISAEMLPRVFDLFVQAERTLERAHGGLGIGLSVVRRLVQMHGGEVIGRSEGPGRGSTFQIRLPLIDPPEQTATVTTIPAPASLRVLVVDDNVDAADSLAELLRFDGHVVQSVYGGQAALDRLRDFDAEVVMLDIGMPLMDGYTAARRIRADRPDIRLVAVTGYGQSEDVRRAQQAGFTAHLTKPIDFDQLNELFRRWSTPQ